MLHVSLVNFFQTHTNHGVQNFKYKCSKLPHTVEVIPRNPMLPYKILNVYLFMFGVHKGSFVQIIREKDEETICS